MTENKAVDKMDGELRASSKIYPFRPRRLSHHAEHQHGRLHFQHDLVGAKGGSILDKDVACGFCGPTP